MKQGAALLTLLLFFCVVSGACYTRDRQDCHDDNREQIEMAQTIAVLCNSSAHSEEVTINGESRTRFTLCGATLLALAGFGEDCGAYSDWWFFTP